MIIENEKEKKHLGNIFFYIQKMKFPEMSGEHFFVLNDSLKWLYEIYQKSEFKDDKEQAEVVKLPTEKKGKK